MSGSAKMTHAQRAAVIRDLNDQFRRERRGGRFLLTSGILRLAGGALNALFEAISAFEGFDDDCDPYREHDFGYLTWIGVRVFWRIEYYDAICVFGSEDPTDPSQTTRVMTVMIDGEYDR